MFIKKKCCEVLSTTLGDVYRSKLEGKKLSDPVLSGGSIKGDRNVNLEDGSAEIEN